MRELSGSIAHFPAERAGAGAAVVDQAPEDELASRRNRGARSAG